VPLTLSIPMESGINPTQGISLILFLDVHVKTIFELGRQMVWPKPNHCPQCGGRLWGHGFISACFDGFLQPLLLPRYRCPDCRSVFRVRPEGYWSRFQASIECIRESLSQRLGTMRWKQGLSRSRQRHWLSGLKKQIQLRLGMGWSGGLMEAFERLVAQGICPVSRSAKA
jgi:hypothetical protein